jgi:nucleotide-binding universal stress UspA family protein
MKVLLAIDTSPASQIALEEVAARPWPVGSSFEVISIIEPSHAAATPEGAHQLVRHVEATAENATVCLRSKGWEANGGAMVDNDPKIIIIDRARTIHADLVVVGSHARSTLGRFLLGSVALTVLRHAPCSVEIVRAKAGRKEDPQAFKVLLATDGSECSTLAASSIAERPWPAGAAIRTLSAAEITLPARSALLELPFLASAIENARAEGITRSRNAVAAAKKILSGAIVTVSEPSAEDGAKNAILTEAAEWGADLIVLGSHGRHGFDRFQLGSVSEAVAMHAQCSVEITRKRPS